MVTLSSADNALKSFYLDAITETLNMKINPFLAMVEKTSENVTGKDVRKVLTSGFNSGVGAGSETGNLPSAQNRNHYQIVAPLKNFYGTLEISDKAIRASANNEGAFVNLLNDEMKTLVNSAKFNFGRMLFGDGSGVIGTVSECDEQTVTVDNIWNFAADMVVDIVGEDDEVEAIQIRSIDFENKILYMTEERSNLSSMTGAKIYMHGSRGNDLTGLQAIFSKQSLYGLDREVPGMVPYEKTIDDYMTEDVIVETMDKIEEASGKKVNLMICSWKVKRAILKYYRDYGVPCQTMTLENGETAIDFYGTPIVTDKFCPEDAMYFLNTDCFKLYQLCDWQWLQTEDGKILKQIAGKPVYTATLVKYAELICEHPGAQGVLRGIHI